MPVGARHLWLSSLILTAQEAEIRRITVRSQPRQIVHETLPQKNSTPKRAGRVAQGVGSEFKPQYYRRERKKEEEGERKRREERREEMKRASWGSSSGRECNQVKRA
jgi:hypothetical protein